MIDGVRYTGIADTEVEAKIARINAGIDNGATPDYDPTVRDLLEAHIVQADRAETTVANWRWAYDALPAPFLERRARDVNAQIVAALWRQLADAPPHRRVKVANLCSTAWQDALLLGAVDVNPFRVVAPPTTPRAAEIVPPNPADVRRLIDAADPWFRAWLLIAAHTGARGGEVCGLQWADLDDETGEVSIRRNITRTGTETPTKTGVKGWRRVPLDDEALDALEGLRTCDTTRESPGTNGATTLGRLPSLTSRSSTRTRTTSSSFRSRKSTSSSRTSSARASVSPTTGTRSKDSSPPSGPSSVWMFDRGDGQPMRPDGAASRLHRLAVALDLDLSPHDLRHFAVTQWLAMGVPIADVAAMIGDNPKTVMSTYAHHIPTNRRHHVARLAAHIRNAGGD